MRYSTESFTEVMSKINPSITILGEYVRSNTGILCECNICKHQWTPTPNKLLQGRSCPVCANKKRGIHKDEDLFIQELAKKNPSVRLAGTYTNGHTKTLFECKVCGHIWEAAPYSINAGHGCPRCYHTSTSFSEQFIFEALKQVLTDKTVINRDRNAIGKELDIYIPQCFFAIEFNGWAWHKSKIKKDAEKVSLCKKKGISMLIVYDSCPEKTLPLECDYFIYPYDLGVEPQHKSLKELVSMIASRPDILGASYCESSVNWDSVIERAYLHSRMKTTEQLQEELNRVTKTIIVLGEYNKSNTPILCECTVCGNRWSPTPNSLLRGNGCPNCSPNKKWTIEGLICALNEKNEHFRNKTCILIGEYIIKGRVEVKCTQCGRTWMARFSDLLRGHGCGCDSVGKNRVISGKNDLLTIAPYLEKEYIYEKNDYVPLSNIAAKSSVKKWWRCSVCGNKWYATVASRVAGHGCPKCYKEGRTTKKGRRFEVSFADAAPSLGSEWSEKNGTLKPCDFSPHSKQKVWWKCSNGHEWMASIGNRYRGSKCPYCSRKRVLSGYNDFQTTHPEIASEWDYDRNGDRFPNQYLSGSKVKVWWKCKKCGYSWEATINDRTSKHGCPKCSRQKKQ